MIYPVNLSIFIVTIAKYHRPFGPVKNRWKEGILPDFEADDSGYFLVSQSVLENGPESVCPRGEMPPEIQAVFSEEVKNRPPGHVMKFEYIRPFLDHFPLSVEKDHVLAVPYFVKPFSSVGKNICRFVIDEKAAVFFHS